MFKTHLTAGFLLGLFLMQAWKPENQVLFMLLILLGSALPDVDHPESKIGRKVKIGAMLFEHRGFFHSLFAALFLFLLLVYYITGSGVGVYLYAVTAGYLIHIISDAFTKEGIMPFHPLSRFRLNGFIRTGRTAEYVLFAALLLAGAWKLLSLGI